MTILKNIFLALILFGIILLLGNLFRPKNAIHIGSGFTRTTPALSYPIKFALISALVFLVSSFFFEGKKLMVGYFVLVGINLIFLFYCIRTYVEN